MSNEKENLKILKQEYQNLQNEVQRLQQLQAKNIEMKFTIEEINIELEEERKKNVQLQREMTLQSEKSSLVIKQLRDQNKILQTQSQNTEKKCKEMEDKINLQREKIEKFVSSVCEHFDQHVLRKDNNYTNEEKTSSLHNISDIDTDPATESDYEDCFESILCCDETIETSKSNSAYEVKYSSDDNCDVIGCTIKQKDGSRYCPNHHRNGQKIELCRLSTCSKRVNTRNGPRQKKLCWNHYKKLNGN